MKNIYKKLNNEEYLQRYAYGASLIKLAMKEHKLSAHGLAKKINVSPNVIYMGLNGTRVASEKTIGKIISLNNEIQFYPIVPVSFDRCCLSRKIIEKLKGFFKW